jgi:transposase-like protein
MDICKFCSGDNLVKSGFVRGLQRYKCKYCGKNQVSGDKRAKYSNAIRRQAISMYLNSCGLRSIGRVLEVPYQLVAKWVENAGEIVEQEILKLQAEPRNITILEMDELYTYIKKNSVKYEYGWLLIGTEAKLLRLTLGVEHQKMQDNYIG